MSGSAAEASPAHIKVAESTTGDVLLSSGQYYEIGTTDAWAYMQSMAQIAADTPETFEPPGGYDVAPDVASTLHANALACSMAQMLAMDGEALHTYFDSMLDFAEDHQSLQGLEAIFLSAGVTVLRELDSSLIAGGEFVEGVSAHMREAGHLLDRAGNVWDTLGGLDNVLGQGSDLVPVLDGLSGQFGFPSLDLIRGFIDNPFETIEDFAEDAAESFLSPGHRLFNRIQHTIGAFDSDAADDFAAFRDSEIGHFVETVASIAIGVGLLVEAPIVRAIKIGAAVVEGAVSLVKGLFDTIFGSSQDQEPRTASDDHHKIRNGEHALVGCWVEDETIIDKKQPVELPPDEGTCPEPDLQMPIPASIPMPGEEGSWPTPPSPWMGGDGLGALIHLQEGHVTLQMAFDDSGFLDVDIVALDLGWDEEAFEDLIAELDHLAESTLPAKAKIWPIDLNGVDLLGVLVGTGDENVLVVASRLQRLEIIGHHGDLTDLLVIPDNRVRTLLVDPDADFEAAMEETIAGAVIAKEYGHEVKPIGSAVDLINYLRTELARLRDPALGW